MTFKLVPKQSTEEIIVTPKELVREVDGAYKTGDVEIISKNVGEIIEFVENAIKDFHSIVRMNANGGIRLLRLVKKNADKGIIGENDHEGFLYAVTFISKKILLPNLKKTNPQAVKDAGFWDIE